MPVQNNVSELWLKVLPQPAAGGNKYDRGHTVIFGAEKLTGATRLAGEACSRIGCGLVSILALDNADTYRSTLPADIMVGTGKLSDFRKVNVMLGGSGGIGETHLATMFENQFGCARVFDAAAIPKPAQSAKLDEHCVLTPHDGEFALAFPKISGTRMQMAREAATFTGACIVLKGAATIIASPDGNCVINEHASPYLAKAGTGDVLAGMIAGLIAQGMPVFWASCAAVWIHGEASLRFGPGLVATDLADLIPSILRDLLG